MIKNINNYDSLYIYSSTGTSLNYSIQSPPTNCTKFQPTGFQQFSGSACPWEDLTVPGLNVITTGSNNPALTQYLGNTYLYLFDDAILRSQKQVYFTVQIPHSYKQGSALYPHIHYRPQTTPRTSQSATFLLQYYWGNANDSMTGGTGSFGTVTRQCPVTNTYSMGSHRLVSFGTIRGTNKTISSQLVCRLRRFSSRPTDTYTSGIFLLQLDFHYQKDTNGSRGELTK